MIEPREEFCEWPAALLLWLEQERGKRRAQREGVESREDHGDRTSAFAASRVFA
jgi:hypothetical protein